MLVSCTGLMARHRMLAADRKLVDVKVLADAGQGAQALERAAGLRHSVVESVSSRPLHVLQDGRTVDLRPSLAAWETGWRELERALQAGQPSATAQALTTLRNQCLNCHAMIGRQDIPVSSLSGP